MKGELDLPVKNGKRFITNRLVALTYMLIFEIRAFPLA